MTARKSGLGRGLDALIPVARPQEGFAKIPLDRISPNPNQPRVGFADEPLSELTESIREVGVLQPVVVRPDVTEGRYILIAGERRWRAAQLAGLSDLPAVIRPDTDSAHSLTQALIENLQREDLSPLEEAAAFSELMEKFTMTHEQIAQSLGRSRSAVSNTLRLLQLPLPIQDMLERGAVTAGHARALLGLGDEAYAIHIAEQAVRDRWSVREVEDAVRARVDGKKRAVGGSKGAALRPAAIIELEGRLSDHLGSKVQISYGSSGGKVTVRFADLDDLERIYRAFFAYG